MNLTVTLQGVEITLLCSVLWVLIKQYNIYKSMRERMNIIWRAYCREHRIPYNALGDDVLVDINGHKEDMD